MSAKDPAWQRFKRAVLFAEMEDDLATLRRAIKIAAWTQVNRRKALSVPMQSDGTIDFRLWRLELDRKEAAAKERAAREGGAK